MRRCHQAAGASVSVARNARKRERREELRERNVECHENVYAVFVGDAATRPTRQQ